MVPFVSCCWLPKIQLPTMPPRLANAVHFSLPFVCKHKANYARAHTSDSQFLSVPSDLRDVIALYCLVCVQICRARICGNYATDWVHLFRHPNRPPPAPTTVSSSIAIRFMSARTLSHCESVLVRHVATLRIAEFVAWRFYSIFTLWALRSRSTYRNIYPNTLMLWCSARTQFEYSREAFAMIF